jgi:hypothetical protein
MLPREARDASYRLLLPPSVDALLESVGHLHGLPGLPRVESNAPATDDMDWLVAR